MGPCSSSARQSTAGRDLKPWAQPGSPKEVQVLEIAVVRESRKRSLRRTRGGGKEEERTRKVQCKVKGMAYSPSCER